MTTRATLISKLQKVLKKHYKPVVAAGERSILEQILYACCLENSKNDAADVAFARLQETYFDWNEVRVTTVTELTEVMNNLADPQGSARRLKQSLQSIFETHYTFDIDAMAKQNLGKSVKELTSHKGITPFVLSYVVQYGLSGHSIPINEGALESLRIIGIITENEYKKKQVPGMERAIPKTKGHEFGSLIHQLGVDYLAAPFSPKTRALLVEVAPDAKDRMPKRASSKAAKPEKKATKKATEKATKKPTEKATKKAAAPKSAAKATKKTAKKAPKKAVKKAAAKKKAAKPKATKKKSPTKRLSKKKPR